MKKIGIFFVAMMCMFAVNFTSISVFATETEAVQESKTDLSVDTGNPEADLIFNTYLETAMLMENDENYSSMFSISRARAKESYVEYVGGTDEEWESFSDMEAFLWDALYLEQVSNLESGMYEYKYGSIDSFHAHALTVHYLMDEQQAAAYFEIMDWQYNYIITNGVPYNFMTGEAYSYFKENATTPSVTESENAETTVSTIVESANTEIIPVTTENTEETGIWDGVLGGLKKHLVIIIIAGGLAVAFLVMYLKRKHRNQ